MSSHMENPQESLQGLAQGDFSMLDALKDLVAVSYVESGLDPQTFMLVRMAALATLDAAPASWFMNLAAGAGADLAREQVLGTLIAIAPVIGTARVVSAAGNILKALVLAEEAAETSAEDGQ